MEFSYNCRLTIISVLRQGKKQMIQYREKKTKPSYRSVAVHNAVSLPLFCIICIYITVTSTNEIGKIDKKKKRL
jgi:hypothetical protein